MDFERVTDREHGIDPAQFSGALDAWCRCPGTVNRRILAAVEVADARLACSDLLQIFERVRALDVSSLAAAERADRVDDAKLADAVRSFDPPSGSGSDGRRIRLRVAKQLPRVPSHFSPGIEFLILDSDESRAISVHKPLLASKQPLGPGVAYMLRRDADGAVSIAVHRPDGRGRDAAVDWLKEKLFPRLLKWARSADPGVPSSPPVRSSLNLVSAEKYADLYAELKEKYGKKLVSSWPENTDPLKFVYEDVAIAAYLLLLWERERLERRSPDRQSFLDLGCGNGLLVYILVSEGHPGAGIDLRPRKIWSLYPADVPLRVSTVIPSSRTVYPDVDWIIGNHSDELTPWIPVIAARSSERCRFFLLPCCPYEFTGAKYRRRCASKSRYMEYIDYVRDVGEECGFGTRLDRLRIPSTKRICLVGWERSREPSEQRENRIREMLRQKVGPIRPSAPEYWACEFEPRDAVEKVRNCTQLDRALLDEIVRLVANQLLGEGRAISVDGRSWNAGRCLELRRVAESIPRESMQRLRKECGGLQTLLRNHRHVFRLAAGRVEFRIPGGEAAPGQTRNGGSSSSARRKTKVCWFYANHPDGCPASDAACDYSHATPSTDQ